MPDSPSAVPNISSTVPSRPAMAANHARLANYLTAPHAADPECRAQVWAMQMALRVEKASPPDRADLLVAAARSVVLLCLDERSAPGGPWASAMDAWCGARIRKIARRARGTQWETAQQVWGVTAESAGEQGRAFVPTMVADVDPRVRKLQIEGTDVPGELPMTSADDSALTLWINPHLEMTVGKTAAQVGHAAMLGVALLSVDETLSWYSAGCPLSVCATAPTRWQRLLDDEEKWARSLRSGRPAAGETAIAVRDAGYTEIAPGSITVMTTRPRPTGRNAL